MKQQYQILLESPMGPKKGILSLKIENPIITGVFSLLGHDNVLSGILTDTGEYYLSHTLHSAFCSIPCHSHWKHTQNELFGIIQSAYGNWNCHGTLLGISEEGIENSAESCSNLSL